VPRKVAERNWKLWSLRGHRKIGKSEAKEKKAKARVFKEKLGVWFTSRR